jgi:hypothetical protein
VNAFSVLRASLGLRRHDRATVIVRMVYRKREATRCIRGTLVVTGQPLVLDDAYSLSQGNFEPLLYVTVQRDQKVLAARKYAGCNEE